MALKYIDKDDIYIYFLRDKMYVDEEEGIEIPDEWLEYIEKVERDNAQIQDYLRKRHLYG